MHLPDGFLDLKTCGVTGVIAAGGLAAALRHARLRLPRQAVPLMGAAGAFIFAAQMLNFPVAGGTSGHLLGGTLCAVLLGPAAGVLVIGSVLIVQCLAFADGGLLSLGANLLNMAIIPAAVGGLIDRGAVWTRRPVRVRIALAAFAAWLSTLAAAAACAGELVAAGAAPARSVFPIMLIVHAFIGLGEAAITAMVLVAIARTRPDLLDARAAYDSPAAPAGAGAVGTLPALGLLAAVALAIFASPWASSLPDGLDSVAQRLGFEARAIEAPIVPALWPEYKWEGRWSEASATSLSGVAGALATFALGWLVARAVASRTDPTPALASSGATPRAAAVASCPSPPAGSTGWARPAAARHLLNPYCERESLIHRLPAGVKLLTALAILLLLAALPPSPQVWLGVAWLLALVGALARLPALFLLRRLILLEPLALGVAAAALFQPHGLEAFVTIALRSTLCLATVIVLAGTTPLAGILASLRRAGLPTILLTVIALMHRYLDVLQDESLRLRRARASRTFTSGRRRHWAALASSLAQLFVRTLQRSQRLFAAMSARGWS